MIFYCSSQRNFSEFDLGAEIFNISTNNIVLVAGVAKVIQMGNEWIYFISSTKLKISLIYMII